MVAFLENVVRMKRNAIKYIIVLAILSVTGIFVIQFGFLKDTLDLTEQQFHESTSIALKEVAWQLLEASGQTSKFDNIEPVKRVANNYYLVNVNDVIDPKVLKAQLIEQFKRHSIDADFEFAIYDSSRDSMIYQGYLCPGSDTCRQEKKVEFPGTTSDQYTFYFGVYFPDRSPYFHSRLKSWYFFTGLLLVVLIFFGYTLWVIIRQRQLTEVQKNFINNLTHELKTPISSIGLSARVLSDRKILQTPNRLFEYVRIIDEQCSRLNKNVEKVLGLASLEKNKFSLVQEKVSLGSFLKSTAERFKQSELGHNAEVALSLPGEELLVWADPFHLGNILQNILENAVKYCRERPDIRLTVAREHHKVHLSIEDNGIGIPKEYRKKIFKRFYRIPTGNVHDVKGFGLGLDYVRKVVKAHGWKIFVTDNRHGGSTFVLIIPILHE